MLILYFLDFNKFFNPVPKPSHPGNINLHMAQENTQGIALKLSIAKSFPLDDGLLPTLRLAISFIGVTLVKKS